MPPPPPPLSVAPLSGMKNPGTPKGFVEESHVLAYFVVQNVASWTYKIILVMKMKGDKNGGWGLEELKLRSTRPLSTVVEVPPLAETECCRKKCIGKDGRPLETTVKENPKIPSLFEHQ